METDELGGETRYTYTDDDRIASHVREFGGNVLQPEGDFQTRVHRLVADTQFSPWIYLVNTVQYDTVSDVLGWQFRLRWIVTPGTDLYFVSLGNWLDAGDTFTLMDRNASTKLLYTDTNLQVWVMDVDGTDAAQKLAILAHLAFGQRIVAVRAPVDQRRGRGAVRPFPHWPRNAGQDAC